MILKTEIEFDAAHRLVGYQGKCSQLHGHRWKVEIKVYGNDEDLDDIGIMWDFTNRKYIKDMFDHKVILSNHPDNLELIEGIKKICGKDSVCIMEQNPTAENLCIKILEELVEGNNKLFYKVKVYESPVSYCEIDNFGGIENED